MRFLLIISVSRKIKNMKQTTLKSIILVPVLLLVSTVLHAQSEWENISSSYFKWGTNYDVKITSSSLNNLSFWNYNAELAENKRNNTWKSQNIQMNLYWKESKAWKITFDIRNANNRHDYKYSVLDSNGKEVWHTGNIYWGYEIKANKSSYGVETYTKYYCDRKNYNSNYTYTDTWDSNRQSWSNSYDRNSRSVVIEYDGMSTITISTDNERLHTFYGVNSLSSISICAGTAANVQVTGFSAQRKTIYAEVKPYISSGDTKYGKDDYWGAAAEYSKAIDKGFKSYDIYYRRASAYYAAEFYNNAIDDFTKALSYKSTEDAYLYRGLAKLAKNDISGIEDLKKGGSQGQALVREFEMDNITYPNNNSSSSKYMASGTGFFIDPRGYIVTNHHVIDGASGIDVFVTKSGKTSTYKAKGIVVDKSNDLAIIKITDNTFANLPPIPYTIGSGTKDVGTSVFAMGYPQLSYLGEEIKVTDGIISSKTGYQGDITTYQISAPIQPGNSGGPLFEKNGLLVGITNAGVSELDNVGYAIKVAYMNNLIEASPETIYTPTTNQLQGLSFTDKIKRISPYVVIIKIY